MFKGVFSKNFWLLCIGFLFFMTSFSIILPELNTFVTHLGGEHFKWITIVLFALTALLSRPFSGKLADLVGRKKIITIGIIFGIIAGLLYPLSPAAGTFSLLFYGLVRLLHGMSAGFMPTAATALVTDILPPDQRGVGMGIWGVFTSVGMGSGQFMASWIKANYGMNSLFMVGTICAVLTLIFLSFISETLPKEHQHQFSWKQLKLKWNDVIEPHVVPAALVMLLSCISSGLVFVITPDHCEFIGIDNKGIFFLYYTLSTILIRLVASSLSDYLGWRKTLILGFIFMFASMTVMFTAQSLNSFILGAVLFGISTGINSPTMFAWNAELSPEHRRGVGAGTLFIALESGIMLGAFSTQFSYHNTFESLGRSYLVGAFFALVAIGYLVYHLMKNPKSN